jgi:hypothetical protein
MGLKVLREACAATIKRALISTSALSAKLQHYLNENVGFYCEGSLNKGIVARHRGNLNCRISYLSYELNSA